MNYVYFIKSLVNKKIYVGKSSKLPHRRLAEHNSDSNTWTKNNGPFILLYYEEYFCSKDAVLREKFYKSGFGREIKKLIIQLLDKKMGP